MSEKEKITWLTRTKVVGRMKQYKLSQEDIANYLWYKRPSVTVRLSWTQGTSIEKTVKFVDPDIMLKELLYKKYTYPLSILEEVMPERLDMYLYNRK